MSNLYIFTAILENFYIFYIFLVLALFGLYLACNVYLIKRVFDKYKEIKCNNETHKCITYTKWAYAGIIINLFIFGMLSLSMLFGMYSRKELISKIVCTIFLGLFVCCIVGSAFLLQQSKLSCDNSYICIDNNTSNSHIKMIFIKISAIIGMMISIILIISILSNIVFPNEKQNKS